MQAGLSIAKMSISLILAPYHTGIASFHVGAGPDAILSHDLIARLEAIGLTVTTHTIPPVDSFEGEIGRSFEVIRRVANAVSDAVDNGSFPIVLAGNCNVSVGVCAGLHKIEDLHIIWFDAHTDLDTPDECLSGYFDGMGMSMLAGQSWEGAGREGTWSSADKPREGDILWCAGHLERSEAQTGEVRCKGCI